MTKCIYCDHFEEHCGIDRPTVNFFGVGTISVNRVAYSGVVSADDEIEIECNAFTPYIDNESVDVRAYNDRIRSRGRRDLKKRHDLGFKKHVKVCSFCGKNKCRCDSRRKQNA